MAGTIITAIVFGVCASIFLTIGKSQINSEEPVGFYTGAEPFMASQISDVKRWNKNHGSMWMVYGIILILTWFCGAMIGDSILVLIPFVVGILVPIPVMMYLHHKWVKQFVRGDKTSA